MTLHIILQPAESDSLVWVSDLRSGLGLDNTADIEKITYLEELKVACSAWGDHAFVIRDELVRWIQEQEDLDFSSSATTLESLRNFGHHFSQNVLPVLGAPQGNPGLILATFSSDGPRVYFAMVFASFPVVSELEGSLWAGDDYSTAKVFTEYYYALSKKSVEDALLFGIHAMRIAHQVKIAYIGEPNAWVYRQGKFGRLPSTELADYIKRSEAIDAAILRR